MFTKHTLVIMLIVILILAGILFFYSKAEKKDPRMNLILFMNKHDKNKTVEKFKDITSHAKPELKNLVDLVKNMMGDKAPDYCYEIDAIGVIDNSDVNKTSGFMKTQRIIELLLRPAMENAKKEQNPYDMATLFLQMDRVMSGDDSPFTFKIVEKDSQGVPLKIQIPPWRRSDGVMTNILGDLVNDPEYVNTEDEYGKKLIERIKSSPNYNNQTITLEDFGNLVSLMMISRMRKEKPTDFSDYAPCDNGSSSSPSTAPTMMSTTAPTMMSTTAPTMMSSTAPTMMSTTAPTMMSTTAPTMMSTTAPTNGMNEMMS